MSGKTGSKEFQQIREVKCEVLYLEDGIIQQSRLGTAWIAGSLAKRA